MKMLKPLFVSVLATVLCLGGGIVPIQAADTVPNTETDPFGKNYYIENTVQDRPFFEVVLPEIAANIEEGNKNTINPHFDLLPEANNPENFQGLGSTAYANINGQTVTAEAFYRVYGDSLHDPNAGMGLLVYQCIQYKLAHPEEEVSIAFSTYRHSVTAAVCVLPESKYYGYMRSLFTTNYDEHGFVRISYMFAEAARMGIKVTLLNFLESYAVAQYNPTTQKTKNRSPLHYDTYYAAAAKTDCYNSYAPGKKVSDYLSNVTVEWMAGGETINMQHMKSCTVSHYLATDGTEHQYGTFYTTANLDENDYLGRNGNSYSQTGIIISDHEPIYRTTRNYTRMMIDNAHQEGIQEFRKQILDLNEEQMYLYQNGRETEIPAEQQVLYLGGANDPVFQLYFTPLGGGVDSWDPVYNPICYHVDRLTESKQYIEFAWNEYGFEQNYLGKTIGLKLEKAFCENPNINNKISVRVTGLNVDKIKRLGLGSEIGHCSIKNGTRMHAKDFLLSYADETGARHNVSILTSCNYIMYAFHYRTNSILVIDETVQTGGDFYSIIGDKYSSGMITSDLNISPMNLTMEVGETYPLVATGSNKPLTWSSGNESCASADVNGVVTANKIGKTTITVTDGTQTDSISVNVVRCRDCYNAKTYCAACTKVLESGDVKAVLSATSYTYDGKIKKPTITVTNALGEKLTKGTHYTVTYDDGCKNVGTYNVTVKMQGDYSGEKILTFKINPIKIDTCTVKLSATTYTYDGKVKTPTVTVTNANGTKLIKDTHYTVTYASGRRTAGTYKVTVKMMGNYSGTKELAFKINPIKIDTCTVKLSATSYTYDGKAKTPTVTVTNANGTKLIKDIHYTVTYASGRKMVGTYKVTVKMKGNYSGTKELTFKINPIKIDTCTVKLSATTYTYDGKVKAPTVTVTNANGTTLTKNTHYTVTYAGDRKNVGTYKVTIKMKGNYSGEKTLTFKINPPKTTISGVTPATKALKVTITKKTAQVSGYQVQYSTSKSFSSYQTKTLSKNTATSTTLTGLKATTTYYVRVRTYKLVDGKKVYSAWSTVKTAKTK